MEASGKKMSEMFFHLNKEDRGWKSRIRSKAAACSVRPNIFFFLLIHNQFFVDPDDLVRDGQKNKQG